MYWITTQNPIHDQCCSVKKKKKIPDSAFFWILPDRPNKSYFAVFVIKASWATSRKIKDPPKPPGKAPPDIL